MSRILSEWNKIGIDEIDREHQALFLSLKEVLDCSLSGDKSEIELRLNALLEIAKGHFRNEEAYMKRINYHNIEAHRNEHLMLEKEFEEGILKFHTDLKSYTLWGASQLVHKLENWIELHIIVWDMKLGAVSSQVVTS